MTRRTALCLAAPATLLLSVASRAAGDAASEARPPRYGVTVIEEGWNGFSHRDLNDRGQVANSGPLPDATPEDYTYAARRFDPRDGWQFIGAGTGSWAHAINDRGDVAGQAGNRSAFLWTERDGVRDLGSFGDGGISEATGVNAHGVVVGWAEAASGGDNFPFRWTERDGMQRVGDLPGIAMHVTDRGTIVGSAEVDGGRNAFAWDERGGMRLLGDVPGGPEDSFASAANDRGQVVGNGRVDGTNFGSRRALLWDEGGSMLQLGALRPGDGSFALDINRDGTVLGLSVPASGGNVFAFVPWVWTEEHGMLALNDLVEGGWQVYDTGAINDRGEIVIQGTREGEWATVLLTPTHHNPEPATLLAAAAAGVLLLARRRRH